MHNNHKYISLMKFIAIILITNSHLDSLYPVKYIGTGGALGNALFFFISGYAISINYRDYNIALIKYIYKRLIRIYPPVLIFTTIYFLFPDIVFHKSWSFRDYVITYVWPTKYSFLGAIIVCYLPLYYILQSKKRFVYLILMIFLLLIGAYIN